MPAPRVNRHALGLLKRKRVETREVIRVYSPGDPEALCDDEGIALETILYVGNDGRGHAALIRGREPNNTVRVREGWDVH